MCRWLAYSGSPVNLEDLLFKPVRSLVMQSKHSRLGVEEMNGDGFGVGWYSRRPRPGLFHSTHPAWNDRNLRELSALAWSERVFAHIRASTGTAVQETNCHPFRHERWLWMHNGAISGFPEDSARPFPTSKPTITPPMRPGPAVAATASTSPIEISAS